MLSRLQHDESVMTVAPFCIFFTVYIHSLIIFILKTVTMKQSSCQLNKKRSCCKHDNQSVTGLQCSAEEYEVFYLKSAFLCICILYKLPRGPQNLVEISAEPTTQDPRSWVLMLLQESLSL